MHTNETVKAALTEAGHILANDDQAVALITNICNKHDVEKKRPYYIFDKITGEKLGMSQQVVYEKRLAKFGNILNMFANYTGRGSNKNAVITPTVVAEPEAPVAEVIVVPEVVETPVAEKPKAKKGKKKKEPEVMVIPEVVEAPEVPVGQEEITAE